MISTGRQRQVSSITIFFLFFYALPAPAWESPKTLYNYHFPDKTVIGVSRNILYSGIMTPPEFARNFHIGYRELSEANPGLDLLHRITGKEIRLPTSWIIPEIMNEGILINLAEMRLYFFPPSNNGAYIVSTFPIGIGRSGYDTPTGNFTVEMKLQDPSWYPNKSSRLRNPGLPIKVPPGPENPLGKYWIQLSLSGYGLHGTNRPGSIGKRVSLGCIRLFPENIEWLFTRVEVGMPVKIINMPVKFGMKEGGLYVEVHRNGFTNEELERKAFGIIEERGYKGIDKHTLKTAIIEAKGIPLPLVGTGEK